MYAITRLLCSSFDLVVNQAGIDHYNRVFNALAEANITAVVTLYHWDMPIGIENDYGAWLDREIIEDFAYYARVCFQAFGDRVKW